MDMVSWHHVMVYDLTKIGLIGKNEKVFENGFLIFKLMFK